MSRIGVLIWQPGILVTFGFLQLIFNFLCYVECVWWNRFCTLQVEAETTPSSANQYIYLGFQSLYGLENSSSYVPAYLISEAAERIEVK